MEECKAHTYNEFQAFLLIYCAGADLEFKDEEREVILQLVDEATYQKMFKMYQHLDDYHRTQWLMSNKGKIIRSNADKEALLNNMEAVFKSDGHYSVMEENMYRMVKRFL